MVQLSCATLPCAGETIMADGGAGEHDDGGRDVDSFIM